MLYCGFNKVDNKWLGVDKSNPFGVLLHKFVKLWKFTQCHHAHQFIPSDLQLLCLLKYQRHKWKGLYGVKKKFFRLILSSACNALILLPHRKKSDIKPLTLKWKRKFITIYSHNFVTCTHNFLIFIITEL